MTGAGTAISATSLLSVQSSPTPASDITSMVAKPNLPVDMFNTVRVPNLPEGRGAPTPNRGGWENDWLEIGMANRGIVLKVLWSVGHDLGLLRTFANELQEGGYLKVAVSSPHAP